MGQIRCASKYITGRYLAWGYSCVTSMVFLQGFSQEYAFLLMTHLVIILQKDTELLQEDLEELAIWENKWNMEFHTNKCVVLTAS